MSRQNNLKLLSCLALALLLTGCGKSDRLPVYSVTGSVTAKSKPAAGVQVSFYGTDDHLKTATAPFPQAVTESDGSFTLTSYEANDGAPAGNYVVTLVWPSNESEDPEIQDDSVDRLRGKFATPEKSPFAVKVEERSNALDPFDL